MQREAYYLGRCPGLVGRSVKPNRMDFEYPPPHIKCFIHIPTISQLKAVVGVSDNPI